MSIDNGSKVYENKRIHKNTCTSFSHVTKEDVKKKHLEKRKLSAKSDFLRHLEISFLTIFARNLEFFKLSLSSENVPLTKRN